MTISSANTPAQRFGFWARLPLSQKLLIAFGVLFVLSLVIAGATLYGLNLVQTQYEETLTQGVEVRRLSFLMDIELLRARRAEKNFLLRWRTEGFEAAYENYVTLYLEAIKEMREELNLLEPFGPVAATLSTGEYTQAQYESDLRDLEGYIDTYEKSFTSLVEAIRKKGYTVDTGFEGEFRTAARAIEEKVLGKQGVEKIEIAYLTMRRAEKDYLARGDQEYVDSVRQLVTQLKDQIRQSEVLDSAAKNTLNAQADIYLAAFNGLVALDQEIAIYDEDLIAAGRAIEPLTVKFLNLGQQIGAEKTAQAQATVQQISIAVVVIVFIVLAIAVLLAFTISRQLTSPIIALTTTAQTIAGGNFEAKAEVSSADEIGTLAQTFNVMTDRLGKAFEDVRRRSLAVQTSSEVSRRLSVATNIRQLATDVVEQVQSAFRYYHAHIYFFDDARENLVMAGGTGEAGATMLARGHKIPKGRGLVGRAANTNKPVLVADVTKAEGWLPNPLLPETRSEIAIPIAVGDAVLGVLDVQQNVINGLTDEDVELLQSLAGQVSISYQNARSFEESRAKAELESMVNTIGQRIQRAATVEEVLQTAIRELGSAVGAARVSARIGDKPNRQN